MKRVVGIATYHARRNYIGKVVSILEKQADIVHVYDNSKQSVNLTDNGKFYFLQLYKEPIYYFSCDDDIIYPDTYIEDMVQAIEKHRTIVTHHGRILKGKNISYYHGHDGFHCKKENTKERFIDVAGTGVTGFKTDYFNPVDIWKSENKKMSDLVFSLEAARQGKKITLLSHESGYINAFYIPPSGTIYGQLSKGNQEKEIKTANEIYDLIY